MSIITDYVKSADFKTEKHSPLIEVPEGAKVGERVDIKVSVGKDIPHPNTTEHYINWISLYYIPDGASNAINVGRHEFIAHGESTEGANKGPVYTEPYVTFSVKLHKSGKLVATSYCNIHGIWDSEVGVVVS